MTDTQLVNQGGRLQPQELYPVLTAWDIVGNIVPGSEIRIESRLHLPDKYAVAHGYTLRYCVSIDSSYPAQSRATVEVWNTKALQWNEVVSLKVAHEFYFVSGPSVDPTNDANSELGSPRVVHSHKKAEWLAESWTKVYERLWSHAELVLNL